MSTHEMKLIHVRRLYGVVGISLDRGRRVLRDLEREGVISPEVIPSGREYISPKEAEQFSKAVSA